MLFLSSRDIITSISDYIEDGDIQFAIILLALETSKRISDLGVFDSSTKLEDIFSNGESEKWSDIEYRWANLLRGYRKELLRLLDRREELILKDSKDITYNDEREYDRLGDEIESLQADTIRRIEVSIEGIVETVSISE